MRVLNQTDFETEITVDAEFDPTNDYLGVAHSEGIVDGSMERTVGTVITCAVQSPLYMGATTLYAWADTTFHSLGPLQGPGAAKSGDAILMFNADIEGLHIGTLGLDTVEIQLFDSSGALTEAPYRHTISKKDDGFMGIVPAAAFRSATLIARRNVEWAIDAVKVLKA